MPKRLAALVLLLALAWATPSRAQASRDGRLTVTVVDQTGGVLPGATVTIGSMDDANKSAGSRCFSRQVMAIGASD